MQSSEFDNYFKFFPYLHERCSGIFSIDRVPKKLNYRHFCIVNVDIASGVGSHWFTILRCNKSSYEVFDSLSVDLEKEKLFKKYLKFDCLEANETQFQSNDSISCGKFCIYYIVHRMYNLDLDYCDFLCETFDPDFSKNEKLVTTFCADILENQY